MSWRTMLVDVCCVLAAVQGQVVLISLQSFHQKNTHARKHTQSETQTRAPTHREVNVRVS